MLTGGESHGPAQTVIVEGLPAGIPVDDALLMRDLSRRRAGHGRGGRMKIETDRVEILSGVRHGSTIGSPVTLQIRNRDWENWSETMSPVAATGSVDRQVTRPRPGHADLAGGMKYGRRDLRDILERASARETVTRVAAGALCRSLLTALGVDTLSWVTRIGEVSGEAGGVATREGVEASPVRCPDGRLTAAMVEAIDRAVADGDTLGGEFTVRVTGLVPGLGSHVQWDRRLDARLTGAVMSIPAIKGVGVGLGFAGASRRGSACHDEIVTDMASPWRMRRRTNNAGGLEGGVTNGEELLLTAAMKPIPTLGRPATSVDIATGASAPAAFERSDTCAVPAAAVVAEAMCCLVLASAVLEKFGGDTLDDLLAAHRHYLARLADYPG
jgi:chorismate synthase